MRRRYLDNIRWVTVVTVVIYHVLFMHTSTGAKGLTLPPFREVQYVDALEYLLYPWFMVLLFIVAGMCSRYYLEKHTVKEFVRSRTRKLLVPSTIGVLLFGWIQGWISMSMQDGSIMPEELPGFVKYIIITLSGISVLWFIQLLWVFSMVLALVRKIEKGRIYGLTSKGGITAALLLGIPAFFSGQVLNTPVISVYRFGIYGFAFFLGYFFFAHDEVIDRISKFSVPLLVLSAALGAFYVYRHFGDNYAVMPVVGCVSAFSYAWAMCLAVLGCFRKWFDCAGRFASYMSSRSFGLYVFHYLTMSAAALALYRYTGLGALPTYLIIAAAGFLGGLALYEAVSRIPFFRWCILGIKKEKKTDVQG